MTAPPDPRHKRRGIGVMLVFRDVTDRRSMEAARTLLVEVVESSEDAIITKTLEGGHHLEQGAERIFGYSRDEMIGTSIHRSCRPTAPTT